MVAGALVAATVPSALAGMASVASAAEGWAVDTPPVAASQLALPAPPVVAGTKAGGLGSSWEVTQSGAFTYTVGLDVPAGRAGMAPQLSLRYSSTGGNGLVGVGWSLAGMGSSITRCGQSLSSEGSVAGVRFDKSDHFCLDGRKLVAVGGPDGSSYGDDGVHYRAEADGYADVASHGSAATIASGPDHFAVTGQNGWIWIYKPHNGTRVASGVGFNPGPLEGDKSTSARRVIWLPDTVEDPSGNSMTWEYDESTDESGAEYLPRKIRYTYHSNGADAHRYVEFEYEPRPDITVTYRGGVPFQSTKRIKAVSMYAPNPVATSLVWKYMLGYAPPNPAGTGHSLLTSVAKCGPSGTCLPAKQFTWDHPGAPAFALKPLGTQIVNTTGIRQPWTHVLDLNGDGADDLLYTLGGTKDTDSPVYVRLGTRDAAGSVSPLAELRMVKADATTQFPANADLINSRPFDLTADGQSEFSAQFTDATGVHDRMLRWDSAAKNFVDTGLGSTVSLTSFADMNGDGLLDYLPASAPGSPTASYAVRMNTGGSFAPPVSTDFSSGCYGPRVVDLDGDGQAELLANQVTSDGFCGTVAHTLRLDDAGTGFTIEPAGNKVSGVVYHRGLTGSTSHRTFSGDFNGDGLVDAVWLPPAASTGVSSRVLWNTGAGLRLDSHLTPLPASGADLSVTDVNGDGRDDIVAFHAKTTVWISRGDGSFVPTDVANEGGTNDPEVGYSTSDVGDFDGDGRTDIIRIVNSQLSVMTHNSTAFDERMTAVSDEGVNHWREHVTYSRVWSEHPENAKNYASSYPLRAVRSGLVVAREVTSWAHFVDNSAGNVARVMRYSFDDPVADVRAGGGFLGFGTFTTWDPQRPAQTTTTFDHRTKKDGKRYPLAGVPSMVTTAVPILTQSQVAQAPTAAKARVTRTRYTPEYRPVGAPGTRYAVLPNLTSAKEWEQQVPIAWGALAGTQELAHIGGLSEPASAPVMVDTDVDVDDTGSTTKAYRQTAGGVTETVTTDYEYRQSPGAWMVFPLPWKQSVQRSEADGDPAPVTRHAEYHYDSQLRRDALYVEKDSPDPDLRLTSTFGYTDYGVLNRTAVAAAGVPARETRTEYAPVWPGQPAEEIYPSQVWLQHAAAQYRPSTWLATHPAYGVTVATATATGVTQQGTAETVTSQAVYDEFGRLVKSMPAGGAVSQTSYAPRADAAGGTNGAVATTTTAYSSTSSATSKSAVDSLGRIVYTVTDGFDGADTMVATGYDSLGRVASVTRPYFGATPAPASLTTYDSLDRPVTATTPDAKTTGYGYPDLFTTETTDPAEQKSKVVMDADGRTASSTGTLVKPDGSKQDVVTSYSYAPFDLLHTATDDNTGHVSTFDYDTLGRRVKVTEPDRGVSTMSYFGTGDLRTETHPGTGTSITFGYDDLGRQTSRQSNDGTSAFVFDTAAHGLGKLAYATSPDGIRTDNRYDPLGRGIGLDYTDPATNSVYATDSSYDAAGRANTLTYPDPDGAGPLPRLTVKNTYNATGYLQRMDDVTAGQAAKLLWLVGARKPDLSLSSAQLGQAPGQISLGRDYNDATGQLKQLTATNPAGVKLQDLSYTYYDNGLVKKRVQNDASAQRDETFSYDTLSRLTGWQLANGTTPEVSKTYGYDAIGNIFPHPASSTEDRIYGEADGSRPHALTSRDSVAGLESFHYDDKGRLVTTTAEDGHVTRAVTYTTFDLPRTVTKDGVTTTFAYDAFGTRVKESSPAGVTFTVPGRYEKRTTRNAVKHVHYLASGDGPIGQTVTTIPNSGTVSTATEFTVTDSLGSTTATATTAGVLGQALHYDPFGARINADGTPFAASTGDVTHGYTGHEQDDELGLINMKGRMYDPALSRFLTPDPVVTNTLDGQSWNPYSYVRNTPLNYTDPTGYKWCEDRLECETEESIWDFFAAAEAYNAGGIAGLREYNRGWAKREVERDDARWESIFDKIRDAAAKSNDADQKPNAARPDQKAQAAPGFGAPGGGTVNPEPSTGTTADGNDTTNAVATAQAACALTPLFCPAIMQAAGVDSGSGSVPDGPGGLLSNSAAGGQLCGDGYCDQGDQRLADNREKWNTANVHVAGNVVTVQTDVKDQRMVVAGAVTGLVGSAGFATGTIIMDIATTTAAASLGFGIAGAGVFMIGVGGTMIYTNASVTVTNVKKETSEPTFHPYAERPTDGGNSGVLDFIRNAFDWVLPKVK